MVDRIACSTESRALTPATLRRQYHASVTFTCAYKTDDKDPARCGIEVAAKAGRCLFHSKATSLAKFKRAFLSLAASCSRRQVALDATGFLFPSGFRWPSGSFRWPVVLYKARFLGPTTFDAVVFHEDVDFSKAHVDGELKILRCQFRQSLIMPGLSSLTSLTIEDSRIDVNLLLSNTPFSANVAVISSTIRGDCVFSRLQPVEGASTGTLSLQSVTLDDLILYSLQGKTLIDSVRVRGNVAAGDTVHQGEFTVKSTAVDGDFRVSGARFSETVAVGVTAKGTISLDRATFVKAASLANSSFYGPVTCLDLVIGQGINFSASYFGGRLVFTTLAHRGKILFEGAVFCGLVRVSDVKLSASDCLSFDKSMFSAGCLLEKITASANDEGTVLLNLTDVFVQPGHAIRLARPPTDRESTVPELNVNRIDFKGADVHRFDLDFEHAEKLTLSPKTPDARRQAADIYRGLRHSHQKHLRYADAGEFFVKEMNETLALAFAQRKYFKWALLGAYWLFSRYGESYNRALASWALWTLLVGVMATGTSILVWWPPDMNWVDTGRGVTSALRAIFSDDVGRIINTGLRVVAPLALPTRLEASIAWPSDPTLFFVLARVISLTFVSFFVIALRRQFQRRPGEDS